MALLLASVLLGAGVTPAAADGQTADQGRSGSTLSREWQAPAVHDGEPIVRVIVQTRDKYSSLVGLVSDLGGHVTKDLPIINAFVAEMSAGSAARLARHPSVLRVSLDSQVVSTATENGQSDIEHTFLDTLNVRRTWDELSVDGADIGVAVIDSGIDPHDDIDHRERAKTFGEGSETTRDVYGHGTHVAGIIAGDGHESDHEYMGIAPEADLYSLKISNDHGVAYESDAIEAMQWVLERHSDLGIRVVNLSINSTNGQSYHLSPLNAAAEILWFNGIVIVVSAGNTNPDGEATPVIAAPANDPFVITVGAMDENGTADRTDDVIAPFSVSGVTADGFSKPDILAPGVGIISTLSDHSDWDDEHPSLTYLDDEYIRLSGTSMAAPMVTGAVALLLEHEPDLTPDQVKYRLIQTGTTITGTVAPYLDVYAAVTGSTTSSANMGQAASQLLWTGVEPADWENVKWDSVNWNSVNWNSVNWNSTGSAVGAANVAVLRSPFLWDDEGTTREIFLPVVTK